MNLVVRSGMSIAELKKTLLALPDRATIRIGSKVSVSNVPGPNQVTLPVEVK